MGISNIFAKRKRKSDQPISSRSYYTRSAGTSVNPINSMEVSAYYRGVMYISTQIAKLPWHLLDNKNKKQENHKITKLLNRSSNPEMTAYNFKLLMIQTAINYGNFYAEIERDIVGRIVNLWPIPTTAVTPIRVGEQNNLVYQVSGASANGGVILLDPRDVLHVRNIHTLDGVIGQSTLAYAKDTLGISKGADIMANSLFANSGTPSGTLEVEGRLSEEAVKRLKEQWGTSHGGRKAGGVAVLEEGLKFNPISMTPEVLQFLESRKFSVLEISRFLGVPPTKLFDNEAATYNNVEQSNLEVATDTLDAWARNLESEIDLKLLNERDKLRTEMDLYAVFRGDMETRSQYFTRMMQTASITPNEIRMKEGLPPYDNGNRFFVATNNFTPADRVDEILDSQVKDREEPVKVEEEAKEDKESVAEEAVNNFVYEHFIK